MEHDVIDLIEPTPNPRNRRCRLLVLLIAYSLTYTPFMVGALATYRFDLFYGAGLFLITYLVTGIVRAKLRNDAVPPSQQEYHYSDKAIAAWFVEKALLCR